MTFKNALCLNAPPGATGGWLAGYWHRCHRRADHKPPHRSRALEWQDGDREPKPRSDKKTGQGVISFTLVSR